MAARKASTPEAAFIAARIWDELESVAKIPLMVENQLRERKS